MTNKKQLFIVSSIVLVAILDGLLKHYAITSFPPESSESYFSIFALTLHKNLGIAFDIPVPQFLLYIVSLLILLWLIRTALIHRVTSPVIFLGAFSIILGASNNLIDRVYNGFTTDYIMIFRTTIFNLSDVLIIFGAISILLYYKHNP